MIVDEDEETNEEPVLAKRNRPNISIMTTRVTPPSPHITGKKPSQFGHITSPAIIPPRPFVTPPLQHFAPPLYPPTSKTLTYPDFHAAHSLAKEFGLTPSIQTLKHLEMENKTVDPCPRPQKR